MNRIPSLSAARIRGAHRAFTLVELLVAVAVLSAIVFVLFRIFDQTQKALRSNVAQVDVMEGGRAVIELLRRELEQMSTPGGATNYSYYSGLRSYPQSLDLPGPASARTNVFDGLYFVAPEPQNPSNRVWNAIMYQVLSRANLTPNNLTNPVFATNIAAEGVGWLARASVSVPLTQTNLAYTFPLLSSTNPIVLGEFQRLTDGVVHFRVTPLDSRGRPLHYLHTNAYLPFAASAPNRFRWPPSAPISAELVEREYLFSGDRVPVFLELELGLLEPQVLERWRSLPTPDSRARFLNQQSARIHYFQQRIAMRGAPSLMPTQ